MSYDPKFQADIDRICAELLDRPGPDGDLVAGIRNSLIVVVALMVFVAAALVILP